MANIDLNMDDLTVPELIAVGTRVVSGLKGNAHFPQPKPSLDELSRIVGELTAANENYREHRLRLNELKTARDVAAHALETALTGAAEYVQETSGGDAAQIMSANLHIEHKTHLWPFGSVGQVIELSASAGEAPGEVDLVWDPVRGAEGYEIEISDDIGGDGPWEQCAVSTQSRTTLTQLDSSKRHWFRLRAIGKNGPGAWSDPVTKYAR